MKVLPVGIKLTVLTITALEISCVSNYSNLSCLASLTLSEHYKSCSMESRYDPTPKSEVVLETKMPEMPDLCYLRKPRKGSQHLEFHAKLLPQAFVSLLRCICSVKVWIRP